MSAYINPSQPQLPSLSRPPMKMSPPGHFQHPLPLPQHHHHQSPQYYSQSTRDRAPTSTTSTALTAATTNTSTNTNTMGSYYHPYQQHLPSLQQTPQNPHMLLPPLSSSSSSSVSSSVSLLNNHLPQSYQSSSFYHQNHNNSEQPQSQQHKKIQMRVLSQSPNQSGHETATYLQPVLLHPPTAAASTATATTTTTTATNLAPLGVAYQPAVSSMQKAHYTLSQQVAAPASSYYQQQQYQQQQQQQYLPHLEPAAGGFSGTVAIHYGRKHSADDVEQHAIVSGSDYGGNVPVATTSHTPQPTTKRRRTVTPRSARSIAASAAVSAADSHIADITAPATVGSSPGIAVPTHQQQQQQQAQRYQPPELTATNGSTHSDELHCLAPPAELAASVSWAKSPPLSFKNDRYAHLLSEGELAVCEILRINPDVYLHVRHAILAAARHANRTRPRRLIPVAPGSYGARLTAVELNSAKGSTNTAGGGGNKAWLAAGVGSMTLTGLRKREAQKMCHIDVNKTSKLFDWYAELGWLHSPPLFVPPPSLQPGSHTVIAHSVLAPMALDNYDKAYREAHDIPEEPVATQTQQHQQPVQQQPIQPVQQQPVQQQVYKHQPMTATPPSGSPVDSTYGSPSSAFPPVSIQGYSPVTSALPPPTVPQFPPSPQSQTTCSPPTLIAPRCLPLPVPSAGSSFASRPPVTLPPPVPSRYIPQRSGSSSFTSSNIDTSINNHISMSAPLIPPLPVRYSPVTASTVPVSA